MSRLSKWKLEKTKVKVVFRLQFHATHIPHSGWDKLFISFIPADTGKPTAKTTKANVRNGNCKWGDPIYETTRLLQDYKSKQYDEKLYKLVVSMGSSRASNLGEATINLADFVDASKPTIATIPLHGCSFGTILHITIQLLTSKTGFREFEQQRELREKGLQSGADRHGDGASGRLTSSEGDTNDQTDKVSARIKFKADASELSSLEEEVNVNEEHADSATGFDGSSNTSGSLYAEKHDTSSKQELDSVKCTMSSDLYGHSHFQSPPAVKEYLSDHQSNAQAITDSTNWWGSNNFMDNELAMAGEENSRLRGSLQLAESSLFDLKLEISSLQGVADELGAETQKLSHELAAEISSSEELAKEVLSMKSECLKYKNDIIELKELKSSPQIPHIEAGDNQVDHLLLSAQLQFSNGISVVESKIRELQKMTVVPRDKDSRFIHLELEALLNFLLDFKLGNGDATTFLNSLPSDRADLKKIRDMSHLKCENGFGLELCLPESVLQHLSSSSPSSDAVNPLGAVNAMKAQIFDLVRELDEAKVEKEALNRKMDQMKCYYEALMQELEENQKRLLGEMQLLRNEHSTCLYTLSISKTEVEALHEEMNQQMLRSVQERRDLEAINVELERRATTSEAALRRARLNYSIAVEKLQKDLELLSSQVTSMFECNENLIMQALPSQPVSEDVDFAKLTQFSNQNSGLRERSAGGYILLDDLKRSVSVQENLYRKVEEELVEMYLISLHLDIYSKALEESLCEANADLKIMNGKLSEVVEELTSSTASKNHLMSSLQKAADEIYTLNEYKSSSISQCSEMALQNRILEDKLSSVSEENYLLSQKLIDWESKYAVCSAENAELSLQLKHEALENEKLINKMSHLKEDLDILKAKLDGLVSSKRNLEESMKFVHDKLANLLFSYNKQFRTFADSKSFNLESMDIKDAVLQLEEVQHNASMTNCQLVEENRNLESEKAFADVSLGSLRSEILLMKQKFKIGILDIVTKLDVSNVLVDRLHSGIESVADKLHLSSEIEEKFARQNELLLADFSLLEDQMQRLTCKNDHVALEILNLDSLAEELGKCRLVITELMCDNQELTLRLSDKTEESMELLHEVNFLKENLKTLCDELHDGKALTDELERKVQYLTICLNKDRDKLVEFEPKRAELEHVRELVSHLELEKSRLAHHLHQQNELMEKIKTDSSYQASFESSRSDLEVSEAQNKCLSGSNNEIRDQLEESKRKLTMIETRFSLDSNRQASEILRLQNTIIGMEEEMSDLVLSKDELEVLVIVLKGKVNEQIAHFNELSKKLREQVMKTEEFKNLSVHLKELKDKAEAECVSAREKPENEFPSAAQDSLRIAFLKEMYETKVQELKLKLSVSQRHGEEMLMRLQDAINEIENRKKSEAVSLKKNEELSTRLTALEEEIVLIISERREKNNAYDRTKAELECALLSLECCKEEKEMLRASLLEFEAEKSELVNELTLLMGQLKVSKSLTNSEKHDYGFEPEVEHARNVSSGGTSPALNLQNNRKTSDANDEHLGAENLRSSIERLHEELENMKNENTIFDVGHDMDPDFQATQKEITQLHKANEELRNMFPLFNEISSGGNALERVLALEIELAEALKMKNKSNNLFQSSFLKQHRDDEAVFKSFRDINELIKEMLELKGRHAALEAELREMHDRYSRLSLQFAEVEGERQKLKMTLKNVRASKK